MAQSYRRRVEIVGGDGYMVISGETTRCHHRETTRHHHYTQQMDFCQEAKQGESSNTPQSRISREGMCSTSWARIYGDVFPSSPTGDLESLLSSCTRERFKGQADGY